MENKRIDLYLDSPRLVSVSLYNLAGRLVRTIDVGKRNAGYHVIPLSGVEEGYSAKNLYVIRINLQYLDTVVKK